MSWVLHSLLLVCPKLCLRCLWSELFCVLVVLCGALGGVCGGCLVSGGVDHCVVMCVLVPLGPSCRLCVGGREGLGVRPLVDCIVDWVPG